MAYTVTDRMADPASTPRPCQANQGGEPAIPEYMDAVRAGTQEELCPFGPFVEEFPHSPESDGLAIEHGLWTRWCDPETGEYVEDFSAPGHWVSCEGHDEGAGPDLNEMHRRGLLPSPYGCSLFGHDCPRYYGFEAPPS